MTRDEMIAHLPLIQGVINRMGNNSFLIKGWTVTLVAAIFALSAAGTNQNFIFIALIPIVVFWFLDSFYLKQERLYRELYNDIATGYSEIDAFTMKTQKYTTQCIPRLMLTASIGPFYFLLLGILVFVALKTNNIFPLEAARDLCTK